MEPILDELKRRLRVAGPDQWERIATEAGVSRSLPRKIVYGDRENPGVRTIQPLLDHLRRMQEEPRQQG